MGSTLTKASRRESAQRDADRERRLRTDCESRVKQALQEAARYKSRLRSLSADFTRMEETLRSMLVYKKQVEQLRQEKTSLTLIFENRCQQYQNTINRLNNEILSLRKQLSKVSCESNPEEIVHAHAIALQRHAEESRKQYERCLDDVANQVVKALLAQKGLREEVGALNSRIHELESQNKALTSMLLHQFKTNPPSEEETLITKPVIPEDNTPAAAMKHYNSFSSDVLEGEFAEDVSNECDRPTFDKRFSTNSDILDSKLSLEDKKRHQVLTKLWTDLKGSEVTPKRLLEALSTVDSSLWFQPQRPISLNLHLPIVQATKYRRTRPVLAQSSSKSEEETTGNETPESGNRDEGYSTMSSDVQTDLTRGSSEAVPNRDLEDLKEATDETDETRLLVTDNKDPDILYIPFNLLNLKPRNSYPPGKDLLPFQHIMRSFSDSHLCIKITTAPSPCYSFSSPVSSSPSIFLLDITDKSNLKKSKGTTTLWDILGNTNFEICDEKTWSVEERLECTTWDAEYIQQWLRLDETRSALQQHHRDLLELEYDRAELEDWSLSLSSDDLRDQYKKVDLLTPGQISVSTLPSIQENNTLDLEEDSNEYLWNNSSYMMDKEGRELITLLMNGGSKSETDKPWPYATISQQISPENSWSSGSDSCHSHEPETNSKRSSAALSGCSDDTGELPAIGTDFTRDFYRLVKFESTKSLASTSSRSLGGTASENGDPRDSTLHNVLTFIAEQQKYVSCKEQKESSPCSAIDLTKEFNIEGAPQLLSNVTINESDVDETVRDEHCVTLKQLCEEFCMNEPSSLKNQQIDGQEIAYADEICLVTPLDFESENCSNITECPVDICSSSINVEITSTDYETSILSDQSEIKINDVKNVCSVKSPTCDTNNYTDESITSSIPETVSKIPRRRQNSKIPISPSKKIDNKKETSKSKIPHKSNKIIKEQKQKIVEVRQNNTPQHMITSERLPLCTSGVLGNIIEGPPHRAVSFHERATSKDVIDELNRMIKNCDDNVSSNQESINSSKLDEGCKTTGWIHVEKEIDLTDPKARANLLDVMLASVSSDSSPTSSCGGSIASDSTEDPPDYGHLHRIHRFHRQKKANAVRPELAVVRASMGCTRPSIIGRSDFFVRYGEKEMEAVASFDFLDELSTTSSSLCCSIDETAEIEDGFKSNEDRKVQLRVSQV